MPVIPKEFEPYMDLVQIRTGSGAFGSGLLVGPGIVLTARHCVADAKRGWRPLDDIAVCLWRELMGAGMPAGENEIGAEIVWPPPGENPPEDLAVLHLQEEKPNPRHAWRYRSPSSSGEKAQARGFPAAAEGEGLPGGKIERNLPGSAANAAVSERTIVFTVEPGLDDKTRKTWHGLSGGPLIMDGDIIGVMREIARNHDPRKVLEAEMLGLALRQNRRLRQLLNLEDAERPRAMTTAPTTDELSGLYDYLYTLDRTREVTSALQGIGPHEGQRAVELFVSGQPEDLCQHFWKRLWLQRLGRRSEPPRPARATRAPPKLLPGKPPFPLPWPVTGGNPASAASFLAQSALSMLLQREQPWPTSLRDPLRSVLEAAQPPLWLCLDLPDAPTKFDRALLEEWRAVWSGLKLPPSITAGYMLIYSGPLPRPKFYDFKPPAGSGLARVDIQLELVRAQDVLDWQDELERRWEEGGRRGPRLDQLAIRLHEKVAQNPPLRLSAIRALLAGQALRRAA